MQTPVAKLQATQKITPELFTRGDPPAARGHRDGSRSRSRTPCSVPPSRPGLWWQGFLVATRPSTLTWCARPPKRPQMRPRPRYEVIDWWISLSALSVFTILMYRDLSGRRPGTDPKSIAARARCSGCLQSHPNASTSVYVKQPTQARLTTQRARRASCFGFGRRCRRRSSRIRHSHRLAWFPPLRGLPSSRWHRGATCFRQCPTTRRRATTQMTAVCRLRAICELPTQLRVPAAHGIAGARRSTRRRLIETPGCMSPCYMRLRAHFPQKLHQLGTNTYAAASSGPD